MPGYRHWRAAVGALFGLVIGAAAVAGGTGAIDPQLVAPQLVAPQLVTVAREARQAIAVIDWFYVQHRACPQPSQPAELAEMQSELGDGYSVEPAGQFVAIRGISMLSGWLYYTSPQHPARCTLWRKLGWDAALIWRRQGGTAEWVLDRGDGSPEQPLRLNR